MRPAPSRVDVRRAGFLAALAVGVLIIAVVSVVVLSRTRGGQAGAGVESRGSGVQVKGTETTQQKAEPTPPAVLPGTQDTGVAGAGGGTGGGASTGKAQASFFRAEDPSRLAARLSWEKLEPAASGESTVVQPRGFVYLRDGSIARITAARGVFFTPKGRTEPESGRFEGDASTDGEGGGVTVEVFDPPPASATPGTAIDFAKDSPGIVAKTKSLVFNAPEAELSTQDAFTIETDKMSVVGTGALVVFDQVEEGISRAEFVKVQDIRIWPEGRPGLQGRGGSAVSTIAKQAASVQAAEDLAKGRRRLYRLSVEDDVALMQGPRRLLASRVEAWLTLINNRLPDGAVAKLGPAVPAGGEVKEPPTHDSTTKTPESAGDLITAGWKGRMILVPVAAMPEEFKGELVALRLTGGSSGPVRVLDEPARMAGEAPLVDYAATRRALAMRAAAGQRVVLSAGGIGTLVCSSVLADLPAGKIDIIGAGELDAAKADGSTALSATFADGLEMQFATRDGWMTPAPIRALAKGRVQAMAARAMASGQKAELTFASVPEGQPVPTRASLRQIVLSGNAKATAPARSGQAGVREPGDEVQGSTLTLMLEPDAAGTDTPRKVQVKGNARATTRGFVIEGESFTADLGTDGDGRTVASNVVATGNPKVSDSSGLSAVAERITADPASGTALLTGNPVSITRQGVTMNAATVKLDQNQQVATVDGSGRIVATSNDGSRTTMMEASWQSGATFDNKAARVDARGSIVAEIKVGENETNLAKGESLVLLLAQSPGGGVGSGGAAGSAQAADAVRQIRSIEIIGRDYTPGSGIAAQLQNRTFAGSGASRALARQIYLEGASIVASSESGTLTVPGAGKLLIDDRRAAASSVGGSNPLANLGTASGRSLFTWLGSLEMNRFTGRLAMRQQVALTHKPGGNASDEQVLLDCNDLLATLRGLDASSLTDVKADLSRVEASGAVRAVTGGREINADRLIYDALGEMITASGTEEQLVSFVDPAQQAPVRARNIEWNLREKRINTEGVAPIILTPR